MPSGRDSLRSCLFCLPCGPNRDLLGNTTKDEDSKCIGMD
jgi:hypothetical protein